MKIIAENPAEEALLWRIKALSDELVNQDNRELKDVIHLLILAGGNEIPRNHYGVLRDA